MSKKHWFVAAWKRTSSKGRIIIIIGFSSLLTILIGGLIMFAGLIGLFTVVGAAHPNTNKVLSILFLGFCVICVGVVGMIIYSVGMSFVSPPVPPEKGNND